MMEKIYIVLIVLISCGCASRNKTSEQKKDASAQANDSYEIVTVTDMRSLDGCGFLLTRNDNTLLNPVNLPDSLSKDGKVIRIKYHLLINKMTTCMSGKSIQIDDFKFNK